MVHLGQEIDFLSGEFARGEKRGYKKGLALAATAGMKGLLAQQCRQRFGTSCATSLAKLLEPVTSTAKLNKVGNWIISCDSADEFLAKVRAGTAARRAASPKGSS